MYAFGRQKKYTFYIYTICLNAMVCQLSNTGTYCKTMTLSITCNIPGSPWTRRHKTGISILPVPVRTYSMMNLEIS